MCTLYSFDELDMERLGLQFLNSSGLKHALSPNLRSFQVK